MNYYNYFTEIEDEFVRRRGSHVLVSPLDWSLIEAWRQLEIPLAIVLRGINASFDTFDRLPKRGRKVNSLLYCQQEVEKLYHQYLESQVGSGEPATETASLDKASDAQFSQARVIAFLEERLSILREKEKQLVANPILAKSLGRAADRLEDLIEVSRTTAAPADQRLEGALTRIEQMILDGIEDSLPEDEKKKAVKEAQKQLKAYRDGMGPKDSTNRPSATILPRIVVSDLSFRD